jgi:hypothetical protein
MRILKFLLIATLLAVCVQAAGCQFLRPSADAVALKKVTEALTGQPGWQVEDLSIAVENLNATVGGQLGSNVIYNKLSDILKKLVADGVIKSFQNNCEIMDATNPMMQDFTAPSLAF